MNPDLYLIGLSVTVAVIGATLAFSFGDAVVKSLMRRRFNRWLSRQEFDVAVPVIPSLGGPEMMVVKNGRCWCVWFTDHPTKNSFQQSQSFAISIFAASLLQHSVTFRRISFNGNSLHSGTNERD